MLSRENQLALIRKALKRSRIVALIGPRQCGKTTLARQILDVESPNYFDLEDPISARRLENPSLALKGLKKLVVIDEIQLRPKLFPLLRVLADRKPLPARFLLLGSASPFLIRNSSESLAGRIEFVEMTPFRLSEVPWKHQGRHWLRGGFPDAFLSRSHPDSFSWLKNFTRTFIERDVPMMGLGATTNVLMRFWFMLAHYHGNVWNAAEPARSLGVNESTVRRYLDLLTGVFMVRQLKPYYANLKKRQVKSPKVYIRDSGMLHYLLGIRTKTELERHVKYGASFEGYVIEELLRHAKYDEAYYWATHAGAELDLLLVRGGKRYGYEIKLADAPGLTPSMKIAMEDLGLAHLTVLYPGAKSYRLARDVYVEPFRALLDQ